MFVSLAHGFKAGDYKIKRSKKIGGVLSAN